MEIYNYDENGKYVSTSMADKSPLEEEVFLIPAMATDKSPLTIKDGFDVVWGGSKWEYKETPKVKPEQPTKYSVWDEVLFKWVEDNSLKLSFFKSNKQSSLKADYTDAIKDMAGDVDASEMASWTKQEQEARAWVADNAASTPVIDNLLIGRNMGETKAQLVAKIIAKADGYAVAYAQVLGMYHAKQKALEACTTVEQVIAL